MRELQQKQRVKRKIYSIPSLIGLLLLSVFLAKGTWAVVVKQIESRERVKELEFRAEALSLRSQELEENIKRLDTEEGLLEEIKEKFSVTQEGERVTIIVDASAGTTTTAPQKESWFKRIWSDIMQR